MSRRFVRTTVFGNAFEGIFKGLTGSDDEADKDPANAKPVCLSIVLFWLLLRTTSGHQGA